MTNLIEQVREYNELARQCRAVCEGPMREPIYTRSREEGHRMMKGLDSVYAKMRILRRSMVVTHCVARAPADPYILHRDKRDRYSELSLYKQVSLEDEEADNYYANVGE